MTVVAKGARVGKRRGRIATQKSSTTQCPPKQKVIATTKAHGCRVVFQVTTIMTFPFYLRNLIDSAPSEAFESVDKVFIGGSPAPVSLLLEAQDKFGFKFISQGKRRSCLNALFLTQVAGY